MLPPKQEPKDKAHQNTFVFATFWKPGITVLIIFEKVAALATFPNIEVNIDDSHIIEIVATLKFPVDISIILSPINLITPKFSIPLIIIKSPIKKNSVSHSTPPKIFLGSLSVKNAKNIPPLKEITDRPLFTKLFNTKPIITAVRIIIDCFNSFLSFNILSDSNSIICALNLFGTFIFLIFVKYTIVNNIINAITVIGAVLNKNSLKFNFPSLPMIS